MMFLFGVAVGVGATLAVAAAAFTLWSYTTFGGD